MSYDQVQMSLEYFQRLPTPLFQQSVIPVDISVQTVLQLIDACLQALQRYEQDLENMFQTSERGVAVQRYIYLVLIAFSLRHYLEMCVDKAGDAAGDIHKFSLYDEAFQLTAERLNSCHQMFQNQWKKVTTEEIWQMCDSSNLDHLKMLLTGMEAIAKRLNAYQKELTGYEKNTLKAIYWGMATHESPCCKEKIKRKLSHHIMLK